MTLLTDLKSALPLSTKEAPYAVEVQEGKTYAWCSCGRSENQPFCDGKHKETNFTPTIFKAERTRTSYLCGCRATQNPPYCDGSHRQISAAGDVS